MNIKELIKILKRFPSTAVVKIDDMDIDISAQVDNNNLWTIQMRQKISLMEEENSAVVEEKSTFEN